MGYQINIKSANSIGHLVEGNIETFLAQCSINQNIKNGIIDYLDDFFSSKFQDFISENQDKFEYQKSELKIEWQTIKAILTKDYISEYGEYNKEKYQVPDLQKFFYKLSNLLGNFEYKFLLLPGFENNELNNLLTNREKLKELIEIRSLNSYLIIQLKDIPKPSEVSILNSFEPFTLALNQIYNWPGILVWVNEKKKTLVQKLFTVNRKIKKNKFFFPVKSYDEVMDFFKNYLTTEITENTLKKFHIHKNDNIKRILHLSDLHLGSSNEEEKLNRLKTSLKRLKSTIEQNEKTLAIISGDLIDTPNDNNYHKYVGFENDLKTNGYEPIIKILGNHDVKTLGFIGKATTENKIINYVNSDKELQIIEELKLIIIRFDSNKGGSLARGEIGEVQMQKIQNQLDAISNIDSYCIIALLHHHPFKLDMRQNESDNWFLRVWNLKKNSIKEWTVQLKDANQFVKWLKENQIEFIMHGHEHFPDVFEREGINVISAGSSMGKSEISEINGAFLTYNIIHYDKIAGQPISSSIYVEKLTETHETHFRFAKYKNNDS